MISKEKFLKYTKALEEYNRTVNNKNQALKVIFPESHVYIDNDNVVELVLRLLSELTECFWEDKFEYSSDVEWFYYEHITSDEPLRAVIENKEYFISTWEDLYNFIVSTKK